MAIAVNIRMKSLGLLISKIRNLIERKVASYWHQRRTSAMPPSASEACLVAYASFNLPFEKKRVFLHTNAFRIVVH